ncbi:MAG: glycosyltransferase family 4 protein [Segniliparus sp.]|uniref:glycosyltransferase family 4 protein n=1 Tax=Segniliparus sp. TaxID=2804064 RepID=UPI003F2F2B0C
MTGSEWFQTLPSGLSRYFSALFAALRERPDVRVSASAFGEPDLGGTTWGADGGSLSRRITAARRALPRRVDVLDRHFALYGPPAPKGAALVTHFHGPWALESLASGQGATASSVKRLIETTVYRRSTRLVVLSQFFGRLLAAQYGVDPARITTIPPGVDLNRFAPTPIPDNAPKVLCVRRLERRMGLDVLLDAWPLVLAAVPHARLDIVGAGPIADKLAAHIAALRLERSVSLLGPKTEAELAAAYRDATVTVVPTRSLEGFGLIALESLASGRAPIVTDVGGLPDSVRGLAPDLIVPGEDSVALAERLVGALQGDRPAVEQCRAHAESFSWALAAERHVALYREALL